MGILRDFELIHHSFTQHLDIDKPVLRVNSSLKARLQHAVLHSDVRVLSNDWLGFFFKVTWSGQGLQESILVDGLNLIEIFRECGLIGCIKEYFFKFVFALLVQAIAIRLSIEESYLLLWVGFLVFNDSLDQIINLYTRLRIVEIVRRSATATQFPVNISLSFIFLNGSECIS